MREEATTKTRMSHIISRTRRIRIRTVLTTWHDDATEDPCESRDLFVVEKRRSLDAQILNTLRQSKSRAALTMRKAHKTLVSTSGQEKREIWSPEYSDKFGFSNTSQSVTRLPNGAPCLL